MECKDSQSLPESFWSYYLPGPLSKGGPLAPSRLVADHEGHIVIRYRLGTNRGGDGERQGTMKLPADICALARWVEHVPPYRFQTVGGCEHYCGNQHSQLDKAHLALGSDVRLLEEPADASWQQICESAGMGEACRCPKCGNNRFPIANLSPPGAHLYYASIPN